jgi:hypothetical protein
MAMLALRHLLASIVHPVSRVKVDIFGHCCKLGDRLDCTSVTALLDIFKTRLYYIGNVCGLIILFWGE